jgi:hypothetical protein
MLIYTLGHVKANREQRHEIFLKKNWSKVGQTLLILTATAYRAVDTLQSLGETDQLWGWMIAGNGGGPWTGIRKQESASSHDHWP